MWPVKFVKWHIENATPFFWFNQTCMLYTWSSFTCHLRPLGSLSNFNSYIFVTEKIDNLKVYSTLNFHLHLLIQCRFLFRLHSFFKRNDTNFFFKKVGSFLDILRTFNDFFQVSTLHIILRIFTNYVSFQIFYLNCKNNKSVTILGGKLHLCS